MSIVSCLTWVKQGKAKALPDKVTRTTKKAVVELDKDELQRIIKETKEKLGDDEGVSDDEDALSGDETLEGAKARGKGSKVKEENGVENEEDDFEKRYHMDDYDEDDQEANPLESIGDLTIHARNEDDPFITLKDDDDSDQEDFEIKPTDNLLLVGKVEDDMCSLEVHVYNEELSNFYVHHDILLPSFPLAVEWLDYDIGETAPGNFVAVGTMEPTIDIWDLDLVNSLEPAATLGTKKKKKKKEPTQGHTDAVLDLSWNANVRNVLGSASADFTVGVWDLSEGKIVTSIKNHKEKVQCLQWHPFEAQSLLSGSFDHTVKVFDCRNPSSAFKSWNLAGEVERVVWNHFSPLQFFASTDTGHIYCIDSRQDKPLYTLSAHNASVSGLSLSCKVPNLLVTTSTDHTLKVWDIANNKPSCVLNKDIGMRQLHCLGSCPESPFVFAMGGEKQLKVWDIRDSSTVLKHFTGEQTAETEASSVTFGTQNSGVAMDTDSINSASSQEQLKKKKKKKKQKKKVQK